MSADDPTNVELREYLEQRLDYEHRIVEHQVAAVDKALNIQAREYARRLDELNHAHQAAVEAQARTVPRETFDLFRGEYERRVGDLERAVEREKTRAATWLAAATLFFAAMNLAIWLWQR